jgi:HlyD family secretion protein
MKLRHTCAVFLIFTVILGSLTGCGKRPVVQVVKAGRSPIEASVSGVTSGTVRAEKIAELAFGTVGRVQELNVELGDRVKAGEILAQVENQDLVSRLNVAKEELERSKRLSRDNAMSRSNLIQAQGAYDAAVTAYEKSLIRAPYDGIIAEVNLEVGQLSQITAVIPLAPLRIIDVERRYVRAEIDEVDLPKVRVGMPARVKILAVRREPFSASVRKVVPFISSVREQDRTSEIELNIESEGVLLPAGASADVEVITETKEDVVALVTKAILGRGDDRYVFRIDGDVLRKTPIKLGIFGYTISEVVSGLREGDEVAMPSDKVELKDGLTVVRAGL